MFAKKGRTTPASTGTEPLRANSLGALIVEDGYQDKTQAGTHYFAYSQIQDVALYTATAAIGMIIYNPLGSGVNMIPKLWNIQVHIVSAAMTGMVMAVSPQLITPTTTTAATLTGRSLLTGSTGLTTGSCHAYSIATIITAPVVCWPLFQNAATIDTEGSELMCGDLKGALGFAPGTVCVIGAQAAAGVDVDIAITWDEVPTGL